MTRRGYLMARMRSSRRHPLVASLIDMWIDRYRHMDDDDYDDCGQLQPAPAPHRTASDSIGACSQTTAAILGEIAPPKLAANQGAHCNNRSDLQLHSAADKSDDSPPSPLPHDSDNQ